MWSVLAAVNLLGQGHGLACGLLAPKTDVAKSVALHFIISPFSALILEDTFPTPRQELFTIVFNALKDIK